MLRSVQELLDYIVQAQNGDGGTCYDFLFDDGNRTVQYLVVDTGNWLPGPKVLAPAKTLNQPDWGSKRVAVALSREDIEQQPLLDEDSPLYRKYQKEGIPKLSEWLEEESFPAIYPEDLFLCAERVEEDKDVTISERSRLISARVLFQCKVEAKDGKAGHLADLILDDVDWTIRYYAIDTEKGVPSKKVLAPAGKIRRIQWENQRLEVDHSIYEITNLPEYDPDEPVNKVSPDCAIDFHGRPHFN